MTTRSPLGEHHLPASRRAMAPPLWLVSASATSFTRLGGDRGGEKEKEWLGLRGSEQPRRVLFHRETLVVVDLGWTVHGAFGLNQAQVGDGNIGLGLHCSDFGLIFSYVYSFSETVTSCLN
jgi:hypothetical protein